MMIQDQLIQLKTNFNVLYSDFNELEKEKDSLRLAHSNVLLEIQTKWKSAKDELNAEIEDILVFYKIAQENSYKKLVKSGIAPQRPDFNRLNEMIELVDVKSRDDAVAGKIIDLISSYIIYLDCKLSELSLREELERSNAEQEYVLNVNKIARKQQDVLMHCEQYLHGNAVDITNIFEQFHKEYAIRNTYFLTWTANAKRKQVMLLGFSQFHFDVPQIMTTVFKESFGSHLDEKNGNISCPYTYTTESHEDIYIEYTELNEEKMKTGIQALILNYIRYFSPNEYKISIFDYVHYNADILGPIAALTGIKNGIIETIPSDDRQLKQSISVLASHYRKIESKLGVQSVFEYNRTHGQEERISYRILIISRMQEHFKGTDDAEILYLLNNTERFGITTINLTKSTDGGSRGKDREKRNLARAKDYIRIISDLEGKFYVENDTTWAEFRWPGSVSVLPDRFVKRIAQAIKPDEIGTRYFKRYKPHLPERSIGKRRPISIPFAIDGKDSPISCSFENETFAAYIMGAAGSGKSTLLHTIISGIIMNYHPDEVELWLLDFKMLEFKKYANHRPPHVKYLLLEKSEDLVFDIIDQMTSVLDSRQHIFSHNKWNKLAEVPPDVYMPAIFVIVDEFAQMSQILKGTSGEGYEANYTIKLENLLAKGRALGLKFIFASQTYTTGISGLTDTACKQIQMRFALKNTPDEIKQTLTLTSDDITPELSSCIASFPPYETLFKWRSDEDKVSVGRFRNMYTQGTEIEDLIELIAAGMKPISKKEDQSDITFYDKFPVLIDGNQPRTFASQIPAYEAYETEMDKDELEDSDVLVYAGVPCSFRLAGPFVLSNGTAQNILLVGGQKESRVSVLLSLIKSYEKYGYDVEFWSHDRNMIYRKFKNTIFLGRRIITDLDEICQNIKNIKENISDRKYTNKMVIVLGYDMIANDLEILGADAERERSTPQPDRNDSVSTFDLSETLRKVEQTSDPAEKRRIIDEYNQQVEQFNNQNINHDSHEGNGLYDARINFNWIIKRASSYGIHFVLCFDQARDFLNLRIDSNVFYHKILFSMSKGDSMEVMRNSRASEVEEGIFVYSNGRERFTMRPHIYYGVPYNGWQIDIDGQVVPRR